MPFWKNVWVKWSGRSVSLATLKPNGCAEQGQSRASALTNRQFGRQRQLIQRVSALRLLLADLLN